jgi:hypothetical protein
MKLIGFNFTKMSGEKLPDFKPSTISTNVSFTDLQTEKTDFLKDEAVKLFFQYTLSYESQEEKKKSTEKQGEIAFKGYLVLSLSKEELKNLQKSWKKKELPDEFKIPVYNIIFRRCTPKAIHLQDQLSLPFHTPMPTLGKNNQ